MPSTSEHRLRVRVTARDADTLRAVLLDTQPDRAHPRQLDDRSWCVDAYVTAEQAADLQREGVYVTTVEDATTVGRARQAEVGKGDRFAAPDAFPHGLADKLRDA